ncbi:MAG: DUF885 domain-containing protein [Tyzzerella sp.]|nr:DUF885 domain-containing protein [Tyzzerella sp.]
MKFKKYLLPLLLCLFILITSCSNFSIPTNANTAFKNFTLCLFQEEVSSNTINLHYSLQEPEKYGITDSPITFGSFDYSETAALASIENWNEALRKFSYNTLSEENQLTYDILTYYFDTAAKDVSYYLYEEPLSPVTGIHAQLPVLLAEYQFTSSEDVETYLALLETLPEYFDSLIHFEQQKSAAGLFMCDAVADDVIEQCNAFVAMGEENYLLSTFEERLSGLTNLTENSRLAFCELNQNIVSSKILPTYEKLASAIAALKGTGTNPQGLCFLPEGKDYYSHLVRTSTGSSRTIEELKELIQSQIAADLMDTQIVLEENASILEETASITQSPDTILKTLENKISNTFPTSAAVNVEIKYVPKALEEYLSPAFYLIPSIDNYNENVIYINQAYSMEDISLFTTLAHEGYPGHLYQTTYYASTEPDPIRTLLNFGGYVEGWATYAEMCSYYLSTLERPMATLLQKNNSIILGLYATADIGIHYDGWTAEDTLAFFSSYGISDEATIQEIYDLILGDPANYLTYYIGYVEILELKKEMIAEMGNDFSQKEFHQKLLDIGPAPFEIIEKYMN